VSTASNHTLYAQWSANSYTVTFNANGGAAPTPASKTVTFDTEYRTLATTSRTSYTFEGWFTAASGGTQVTATSIVSITSDHTLFAQWTLNPALSLTTSASPTTYNTVGQTINYVYVIKNVGIETLNSPFTIIDDKLGTFTCVMATSLIPDSSTTCTNTYSITQADLDAGSVTNQATATVNFNNITVPSDVAITTVNAVQTPKLSLIKSANPLTYTLVGETITYTYILKNIGNVTLTYPFSIYDTQTYGTCPDTPTNLVPSSSITCTASYTITQVDVNSGKITNVALGYASFGRQIVVSNSAQATVTVVRQYLLTITKSGIGSGTVTDSSGAIDCGATCTANFKENTSVTLTAASFPGSTFTGWGGACSGVGTCQVAMTDARSVTAYFILPNYAPCFLAGNPASMNLSSWRTAAIQLHAFDLDHDKLTWQIVTKPAHGFVFMTGKGNIRKFTYIGWFGRNPTEEFVVKISDGKGSVATFPVTVIFP